MFDDLCFVKSPNSNKNTKLLVSWTGIPVVHSGETLLLLPKLVNLEDNTVKLLMHTDKTVKEAFFRGIFDKLDVESLLKTQEVPKIPVISGFTVSADALECSVYLMECETIVSNFVANENTCSSLRQSVESLLLSSTQPNFMPNQEALIARLRHPNSASIIVQIKKLLKYLCSPKIPVKEKAQIVQKFYEDIEKHLKKIPLWSELGPAEMDASIDGIERYIFFKVPSLRRATLERSL